MATRKRPTEQRPVESDGEESTGIPSPPESIKRSRMDIYDQNDVGGEDQMFEHLTKQHDKNNKEAPEKNTPADGGIITKIHCENFMCHENLEIPVGPLTNFVVGHNGSGKSAVLTAFTLCMGGKAAGTNRGASIKDMIRTGSEWARITVYLKNQGNGFKPKQYGDEIRIMRHFNVNGSNGYKLQSKLGKTISTKREELDELCDFYGIQVDNPITVLTQDLAREFLSSASNVKKYEFFAKGVQLEQLDQDYRLIAENNRHIEATLHGQKNSLQVLKKQRDDAKVKLDQYEHAKDYKRNHEEMLQQMAWAQVVEAEGLLAEKDAEVKEAEAEAKRIEEIMPNLEQLYTEADDKTTKAEKEVHQLEDDLKPLEASLESIREELKSHMADVTKLQVEERNTKAAIKALRHEISQKQDKIKAEEDRLAARDGGHNRRLQEDIENAKVEVKRLSGEEKALKARASQLEKDKAIMEIEVSETSSALKAKKDEINLAKNQLQSIRNDSANALGAYSHEVVQLIQVIDKANWHQKPIGPLGRCVTLIKPQWENIVERYFGTTFSAFLCTNDQDANTLRGLIRQCRLKHIQVLVSHSDHMDPIKEPAANYDTILRVLEIPDDRVRHQLIILHGAEQAVLIDDPEEAKDVVRRTTAQRDNVAQVYTLNADGWGARIAKNGFDPIAPWNNRTRMCKSRADEEKSVQHRIQSLERDLGPLEQQHRAAEQRVRGIKNEITRTMKQSKDARIAQQKAQEQREELSATLTEAVADGTLTQLNADLEEKQNRLEIELAHFKDYVVKRDAANKQGDEINGRKKAVEQDIALYERRLQDAKTNLEDQGRIRFYYLQKKNNGIADLDQANLNVDRTRGAQQAQQDRVIDITEQASSCCDRVEVPPGETAETLDIKLTRSAQYLDQLSKQLGGSEEELSDAYTKAFEQYAEAKSLCNDLNKLLLLMHNTHDDRRARWKQFLQAISARARSQFLYLMSMRDFKGRLRLDHTQKELIIEVQPGLNETGNRGPKGLSGGEKSLSTICLLLALWEAMGSPIRCLDEFDVFMDPVNRDFSVKMMVDASRRAIGKQFILITPQGMTKLPKEDDQCKVLKMPEPERGQRTMDGYVQR